QQLAAAVVAALVVLAVGTGAVAWYRLAVRRNRPTATEVGAPTAAEVATLAPARATVRVRTTPPGGSIHVDGQTQGVSDVELALDAGDHQVEAALVGYIPAARRISVAAGAASEVELVLQPVGDARTLVSQQRTAQLRIDGARRGLQILLDEKPAPVGTIGAS